MRASLTVKVGLLITTLVTLSVGLVAAFLLHRQQQSLTDQMVKRGSTIAENLAAAAKSPLLSNDHLTRRQANPAFALPLRISRSRADPGERRSGRARGRR